MDKFVYPDYNGKSLLNLPSTILRLFGASPLKNILPEDYFKNAAGAEKIILFLIDGLGFNLFQKASLEYPFFQNLKNNGFTSDITTVFPSTTAAALNSLYSGLSPLEHGLPEWFCYFPELDAVLESLPFNPVDKADLKKTLNPPKDILFKDKTIFEYLGNRQVLSFSLVPQALLDSLYTKSSHSGSQLLGFKTLEDLMETVIGLLETKGKVFIAIYYTVIDSAEHQFGHLSNEVQTEISKLSVALNDQFIKKIHADLAKTTALMLTADHGQVTIDPKDVIFLDEIPGLRECLKNPPTSGTRNAFLNIKQDKFNTCLELLKKHLEGKAYILEMREGINNNLFGDSNDSKRFLARTGNLVLVALFGYTLGYHYTPDFELKLLGRHGGLSADEMLIPFACARVSELKI